METKRMKRSWRTTVKTKGCGAHGEDVEPEIAELLEDTNVNTLACTNLEVEEIMGTATLKTKHSGADMQYYKIWSWKQQLTKPDNPITSY